MIHGYFTDIIIFKKAQHSDTTNCRFLPWRFTFSAQICQTKVHAANNLPTSQAFQHSTDQNSCLSSTNDDLLTPIRIAVEPF